MAGNRIELQIDLVSAHAAFAELAKKIAADTGIRVTEVRISWDVYDASTIATPEEQKHLINDIRGVAVHSESRRP